MTLRDLLAAHAAYSEAIDQIENQVTQLCSKLTPPAFYTLHDTSHLKNVESNLNRIVMPDIGESVVPQLNESEVFVLLAGCWLHDIGMLRGLFDDDSDLTDEDIRHTHEQRSAKYVADHWPPAINLGLDAQSCKIGISEIVIYHRKRHDITQCLKEIVFDGRNVRLRLLAVLLRLADATELNCERTPDFLRRLYHEMGMSHDHFEHWTKYRLVNSVEFHPEAGEIRIRAIVPRVVGGFSFESIVNILSWEVQQELNTIRANLAEYPGLAYRTVTVECQTPVQFPNREEIIQAFAPYIVMEQPSAGTMAARFADVLLEAQNMTGHLLQKFAKELFDRVNERRPGNGALANLWKHLARAWNQKDPASVRSEVQANARQWLKSAEDAMERIKRLPPPPGIQSIDVLIVLSYSSAVRAFLEGMPVRPDTYVAEIRGRSSLPWRVEPESNEGIRMALEAANLGYRTFFVEASWVPAIFQRNKERSIVVLCGARGVLRDGAVLNTPGHLSVAIAAQAFNVPFYVVTELSKVFDEPASTFQTREPAKEFSDIPHSRELREAGILIRRPYIEQIPPECITGFITEQGISDPHEIVHHLPW